MHKPPSLLAFIEAIVFVTLVAGRGPALMASATIKDVSIAWRHHVGRSIKGSAAVTEDGLVYVASTAGIVHALDRKGTSRWRFDTGFGIISDIAIGNKGIAYVSAGALYALNPDGSLLWRIPSETHDVSSAAVGLDGTLYFSRDLNLCAATPEGEILWESRTVGTSVMSPVVGNDGTIYVAGYKQGSTISRVYAFTAAGNLKYQVEAETIFRSSPAIDHDGVLYIVGLPSTLYAISPNGQLKWTFKGEGVLTATPVIGEDHVIYVGSKEGLLYAINSDGSVKWKFRAPAAILGSAVINSDGVVSFASGNKFCSVSPGGDLKSELQITSSWRGGEAPVIAADGTIYLGGIDGFLYVLRGFTGPAASGWPMKRHDERGTARQREQAR